MSKKRGTGCFVARPRKPASTKVLVGDHFPAALFYKRRVQSNEFTPATMECLGLLAASGATWADIAHVGVRAFDTGLAEAAALYVDAGHGNWYAARYTRFVRLPSLDRAKWQALYIDRPSRCVDDPADFDELRHRLVIADLERDELSETYGLTWKGKRDALLEALTPISLPTLGELS